MKISDFIVCEDVRLEVGHKHTLVGVYDSDIKVGITNPTTFKWPIGINLALFLRLELKESDPKPDYFEAQIRFNGKDHAKADGTIHIVDSKKLVRIYVKMPGFPLLGPGKLTFHLKFSSQGKVFFDEDVNRPIEVSLETISSVPM